MHSYVSVGIHEKPIVCERGVPYACCPEQNALWIGHDYGACIPSECGMIVVCVYG